MEKVNGKKHKLNIVEDIAKEWNKDMDNYIFLAVIFTKVISFKIESKVMARCFGLMVVFTKDNGKMVLKMEKGRYT